MFHDLPCEIPILTDSIRSCRLFTNVKPWTAGHSSVSLTPRLHGPKLFETYSKPIAYTFVCYHCWWKKSCISWQGSLCHDLHGILFTSQVMQDVFHKQYVLSGADSDTPRKNSAFLLTSTPQNAAQTRALRPPPQCNSQVFKGHFFNMRCLSPLRFFLTHGTFSHPNIGRDFALWIKMTRELTCPWLDSLWKPAWVSCDCVTCHCVVEWWILKVCKHKIH